MNLRILRYSLIISICSLSAMAHAGDITKGKKTAAVCAGCHGADGIGISQEFPNLAGQKEFYLIKQLTAFKSGSRSNPSMKAITASLNANEIDNVAAYFSSLSVPASSPATPAKASIKKTDKADKKITSKKEFPDTIFISMKQSGTIQTLPAENTWEGGPNMLYTAITPDKSMLLSTSPSSNSVYVFNAHSGKQLAIIEVGTSPKGVKVTPNGKFAYVSNQGSADISVIDLNNLTLVDTISVEEGPHNVRFTNDGKLAYVTLQGGAGIGVIDTKSRNMTKVIPTPGITGPHNLDLSSDQKTLFVRDFVHHVAVVDLSSGDIKKVITVGNGHGGIDVTPDGRYAATAAIADNFISVIDTKTLAVTNIQVGNGPHGIRSSKDSKWLYVTLTKDNEIAVINTSTLKVEKKIAVGELPFWIAVPGNS